MKNLKDLFKQAMVSSKKLLAGVNLLALTLAVTPNDINAQDFGNTTQVSREAEKDLTTNIKNVVENSLPNTSNCFTDDPKMCRFESEYPTKTDGDSAIFQIKNNLSDIGCRVSLDKNGCEYTDKKICQLIWWECLKGIKVRGTMYIRTK